MMENVSDWLTEEELPEAATAIAMPPKVHELMAGKIHGEIKSGKRVSTGFGGRFGVTVNAGRLAGIRWIRTRGDDNELY